MKVLQCSDQTCHNFSLALLLIFLNQSNPKHSNLNHYFNNTDLKFREILHPMQVKCWTHQHLLSAFTTKSQVEILSALLSLHIIQIVTFKQRSTFPPCGKDGSIQFEIKVDIKPEDVDNCNLLCNNILWNLVCFYV